MSELTLPEILAAVRSETSTATVTDGWMQGRAAYGGLGAALAAAGMRQVLPEDKALRSLMVSFVGPIPAGNVTVASELLRQGKNVSQATVRIKDGETVCLQAAAAFGGSRDTKAAPADAAFTPEPRDSRPPLDPENMPLPAFLKNFDIHWTGGGIPTSARADRRLGMWVKHKADMEAYKNEKLIALADIPPPVMMSHYDRPIMASSLSWALEFVVPAETVDSDWFYLEYQLEAAEGGYSQQSGRIFADDGTLVALSRQCMTYFE